MGISAEKYRTVYLDVTQAQIDLHMAHVKDGDVIIVNGMRKEKDGPLIACEAGQETPLTIRIIKPKEEPCQ